MSDEGDLSPDDERLRRRNLIELPALALLLGLVGTIFVWFVAGNVAEGLIRSRFDERSNASLDSVESALRAYLDEIHVIAAFSQAEVYPDAERLQSFVNNIGLLEDLPGPQAVFYVERIPRAELAAVIEARRAYGSDDFAVITSDLSSGDDVLAVIAVATDAAQMAPFAPVDVVPLASMSSALYATIGSREPTVLYFDELEAELASQDPGLETRLGMDPAVLASALEQALGRTLAEAGHGIAVPVLQVDGTVGGWIIADMVPTDVVASVGSAADRQLAIDVAVRAATGEPAVVASTGVPGGSYDTVREVRIDGLSWTLEARSTKGFGSGTKTAAREFSMILGLFVAMTFTAIVFFRGRAALRTEEIMDQLETTEEKARRDPLTGLMNRAGFLERVDEAIGELDAVHKYAAVLFIDVDRLKVINDSLGHSVGDIALREIGRRFAAIGRWTDTVARFGGDEFVFLVTGLQEPQDAVRVGEQILATLSQPIQVDEMELVMSASVGISLASQSAEVDGESLVRDADTAMYEAKAAGGNRIQRFDDGLRVKVTGRLEIERTLRTAVERGEIDVHFQPIVDSATGRIVSAEALLRWFPPDGQAVSPAVFIPVATETGMVVQLGDLVVEKACILAAELEALYPAQPHVSVAVNVAERQLLDPGFIKRLRYHTTAANIWPQQLTLEITEDVVIDRLGRSLTVLRELAELGFGLAIDDFGTGLSSLSYFKRLDMVKYLKIDRSFVIDVVRDPADQAIVASIMAMARSLGVTVIAEGVEQPEQANLLRQLGVHRMQGFLWSKAVSASNFRELVIRTSGPPSPVQPSSLG